MREIEIKARVSDPDATRSRLQQRGLTLDTPIKQHDVVYGQRKSGDDKWGHLWLRIRTENDHTVIFTFKKSVVGHLDSIEHEVEVSNASELEAIIKLLGFELYSDLTKTRTKGKLGAIEICLDNVPGLGDFIEAELLMGNDANHDEVVRELRNLFAELGISEADEVHEGYDVMMRKKLLSASPVAQP